MYDTKTRELRWNATYFDYAAALPEDDGDYSKYFETPWTVALQTPLSMGFSRHEYWKGLSFPSPGDLPEPETEAVSLYIYIFIYTYISMLLSG